MGTNVFPALPGITFPIQRSPVFDTRIQTAISGKETAIALQSYPRWKWEVPFSVLRSSASLQEMQELVGFFNALLGRFDTFLYQDADDNAVTTQPIAVGDGSTTSFQLVRTFGAGGFTFVEPVLAPNLAGTVHVYLNGTLQSGSSYTITPWGTSNPAGPGVLIFNSAPGSGVAITADFPYYWPCRMQNDSLDLSMFLAQYYEVKKFAFMSVKNQ